MSLIQSQRALELELKLLMYSRVLLISLILMTLLSNQAKSQSEIVFSGNRAMEWLEYQCQLGPRTMGSPGSLALQDSISTLCKRLNVRCVPIKFKLDDPYGDSELTLTNIVISLGPSRGKRLWLGAHYDSRPVCDKETNPVLAARPLVGANDGASGVAVLLHLIELLHSEQLEYGIDILLFDGEDYGHAGDVAGFCLGSKQLVKSWNKFGSPLAGCNPYGLILLDMVGEKNLQIPMEYYSVSRAPVFTEMVFQRASQLSLSAFIPETGKPVYDDHVPFLEAGLPAVDLIDFDFPEWHTSGDVPSVCSPESLQQVGALLLDICLKPLF
jgi:glutaminyl-peptide cyclotransferase